MRLIHTENLTLHDFLGQDIPKYVILSHTWWTEEILFRHVSDNQIRPSSQQGFHKIQAACHQAVKDEYSYLWVDTCCINSDSSAELSEAINSMFQWYKGAAECYAFLADVDVERKEESRKNVKFENSRWFTRGWTLQELLAPANVYFFDQYWNVIGTKHELEAEISAATGIASHFLTFPGYASIAQKMSWMSKRQTSRSEDIAYCLLGLFDVNMPLLYGEGEKKAFLRLQHAIIEDSNDESIFAWTDKTLWHSGMLARSPKAFKESGNVVTTLSDRPWGHFRPPYTRTNLGLKMKFRIHQSESWVNSKVPEPNFTKPLNCKSSTTGRSLFVKFKLLNFDEDHAKDYNLNMNVVRLAMRTHLDVFHYAEEALDYHPIPDGELLAFYFSDKYSEKPRWEEEILLYGLWRPLSDPKGTVTPYFILRLAPNMFSGLVLLPDFEGPHAQIRLFYDSEQASLPVPLLREASSALIIRFIDEHAMVLISWGLDSDNKIQLRIRYIFATKFLKDPRGGDKPPKGLLTSAPSCYALGLSYPEGAIDCVAWSVDHDFSLNDCHSVRCGLDQHMWVTVRETREVTGRTTWFIDTDVTTDNMIG